jgi:uncharacterized protein (TIGR02246 family)
MDDAETEVLAANERFYQAFNLKDPELMAAAWTADGTVTCVHPGWNALEGREAVLESWRSILTNPNQPRIVAGGATVTILGEVALVVSRELVAGSPLIATNVFRLEDGGWRLIHHQSGPVFTQA